MSTLEERIKAIEEDTLGNLSTRESVIFERASERAEIIVMYNLIDYDPKNTTETWRTIMRNMLAGKVDAYYKKYGN